MRYFVLPVAAALFCLSGNAHAQTAPASPEDYFLQLHPLIA
jgi:hypothetical protein